VRSSTTWSLAPHLIQINEPGSHRPHTPPAIQGRWGVRQEADAPEFKPWERAPVSGYYQLLNGFGRATGERAFVQQGHLMPSAPRPLRWRLMVPAENDRERRTAS
jgi:hypothetical protein